MTATSSERRSRVAGLGLLTFAMAGLVAAQAPPQVPTPGTVREPLKAPLLTAPKGTLPEPAAAEPFQPGVPEGGPKITLTRFVFTGNATLSSEELLSVIAEFQGKPLTLLEIYELADRLTDYYRNKGYILAQVTIPAQKVSSGTVRFEVLEGRIGTLQLEGNTIYSDAFLSRWLDELVPGQPLLSAPLERRLLLINDLPGITARSVVRPGVEFGTSDIIVQSEERRIEGDLRLNNYGRRSVGEGRIEGNATVNNPFGWGDRFRFSATWAQRSSLRYGSASYSIPVTTAGTRVSLFASRFLFDVRTETLGAGLQDLELTGDGDDYRLAVTHPLRRSRRTNVSVGAALERLQSHSGPGAPLALPPVDRSVTLLEVSARGDRVHENNSITSAAVVVSTNFRNQVDNGTRNNAQPGRLEVDISHLRPFGSRWSVFARGRGVYSLDPLMDLTKFRIGGPGDVRAYPSGEVAGDRGFGLTLQLNRQLDLHEKVATVARVFGDMGKVYRRFRPLVGTNATDSLYGVGIGITASFAQRFTLDVELATPIGRLKSGRVSIDGEPGQPSDGRDGGRIWVELVATF